MGTNALYILLLLGTSTNLTHLSNLVGMTLTWMLQYYSYTGIVQQAAAANHSSSKKQLVGGQYLDGLALSIWIQFTTVLHSSKWFFLLGLVPIGFIYSLYTLYRPSSTSKQQTTTNTTTTAQEESSTSKKKNPKRQRQRPN